MASAKWRTGRVFVLLLISSMWSACAATGYSPYPLDLEHQLPSDAFQRCREVLLSRYGTLVHSNAQDFQLETAWQPISDPPGERRASVYRDDEHPNSLSVVVELRRLTIPLVGVPHWTSSRGDNGAERELAQWLRESLRDPEVIGGELQGGDAPARPPASALGN